MNIKAKPIQWETVQLEDGAIKYGGDRKAGPEDEFRNHFDYVIGVLDDRNYIPHYKLGNRQWETLSKSNYVIGLDDAKQLCQIHKNQRVAELSRLADITTDAPVIDQTNDYYFVTNEDLNAWGLDPFMDGTGTELWLPRTWSKAVSSFNRVGLKWAVNYMDGSRKVYSVHSQIEAEAMFKTEMEGQPK